MAERKERQVDVFKCSVCGCPLIMYVSVREVSCCNKRIKKAAIMGERAALRAYRDWANANGVMRN